MIQIRKAEPEDIEICLATIDPSYITDHVWQLIEQAENDATTLTFRLTRLPRPLRVEYPRSLTDLGADLKKEGACLLVAEQDGRIRGLLDLVVADWHQTGWLKHLVVIEPLRRQRIGTQLLRTALAWAESQGLRAIMADCQTKNYPAIAFYRKSGFTFCGYNDKYYVNKDIALFFAYTLRKR